MYVPIESRHISATSTFDAVGIRQRPYFVEYTRSHPNSEVKRRKARSVLGWGTAREALRVLLAFLFSLVISSIFDENLQQFESKIGSGSVRWAPDDELVQERKRSPDERWQDEGVDVDSGTFLTKLD